MSKRISGFVLPLGYSFNLDGSMMYQSFAVLFIAQAYNIEMSFSQQLTLLLVLMVTSKGMAGVARASLVVVAATLPMFHLPEAGLLLIMGIDQFFDMGRTATNVVGNSLATAVIAKMEGGEDDPTTAAAGEAAAAGAGNAGETGFSERKTKRAEWPVFVPPFRRTVQSRSSVIDRTGHRLAVLELHVVGMDRVPGQREP